MANYSEYKQRKIDSVSRDGCRAPAITRILTKEFYQPQDKEFRSF